jgi:hypothetical protein
VAIEKLSVAQSDPQLVLSSCSDGCLRLYDIRAPSPVATMAIGPTPLAGMVLEPCGQPGSIVIGESAIGIGADPGVRVRCYATGCCANITTTDVVPI